MIPPALTIAYQRTALKHLECLRHCRQAEKGYAIILMVALFLLSGCNHKELVYPEQLCLVNVRFNWEKAEGADPKGMTLLFYPQDEHGEFWRFEIPGRNGGPVELTQGRYSLIAVNNDLPGIMLTDLPYSEASLTALEALRSVKYTVPTGMPYVGIVEPLDVYPGAVSYPSQSDGAFDTSTVVCPPDSAATIFNLSVEEIEGLERVRTVDAVLEGCAEGVRLPTLSPIGSDVSTLFELDINTSGNRASGATSGFLNDPASAAYSVTLRFHYYAGGGYEKKFDVTQQVLNSPRLHNVYLHINGLSLPQEPADDPNEVGLKVDVDGWSVLQIDINS
ncbi:MAG: DUF5119 domain-containing protein [Muribaculaceae bacterium]|nr:DUF5119 domain-containing protein [Muribaculaceae bacterium]